jgi:hypothetical protein
VAERSDEVASDSRAGASSAEKTGNDSAKPPKIDRITALQDGIGA